MDLYEALKTGTSEEELKRTFTEDLAKARMKIAAERQQEAEAKAAAKRKKEEEKKAQLEEYRDNLIECILDYASVLLEEDLPENAWEDIEKELLDFEKHMTYTIDFASSLASLLGDIGEPSKIKIKYDKSDDEIIKKFLESFK